MCCINKESSINYNGIENCFNIKQDNKPLLRFEQKHDIEIKYLNIIINAYQTLNFKKLYELLFHNCFKITTSNQIIGKEKIIDNYEELVKIAKQNNIIYQGSIYGELTYEREPILAIHFVGKSNTNIKNFSLSIRLNKNNLIHEINIKDDKKYASKFLDNNSLNKVKNGQYSNFNEHIKVNERLFTDQDITFLLNFFDNYFKNQNSISLLDIENKLQVFYNNFNYGINTPKNMLIDEIIHTTGKVEYNDSNIVCSDCGCKYITSIEGGYLRKREKGEIINNNHKLIRHGYGCIITGNEYGFQCLGCGKKWK